MSIRIIQQQLFQISEYEEISESLSLLSSFSLVTLDYLRGQIPEESYIDSVEAVCRTIIDEGQFAKASPILDSLLATVFYYKQENISLRYAKLNQKNFSILLKETYCQLIEWAEEEIGEEFPKSQSDTLFEDFALDGGCVLGSSSRKNWGSTGIQLDMLQKYQLLPINSRLLCAIMHNRKDAFFTRYPLLRILSELGLTCSGIMGVYMLTSIFLFGGRLFVELPYLKLLHLKGANNASLIGEIYVLMDSLLENGLSLYSMQIVVFISGFLLFFGINFVAKKFKR